MTFTGIPFWGVASLIGAVAALLGVLHLLRVRPRPVRVVTTLFWAQAIERTHARSLLDRFRHPLTFALLLAVCGLVIASLGKPELTASGRGICEVIVLDAGVNMTAGGDGNTDYDRARVAAVAAVESLSGADRAAVVVLDPLPRLVHGFDQSPALLARELETVQPARVPASLDLGCAAARSLLNGVENGRVTLISNLPRQSDDGVDRFIRVGESRANAAIVSVLFLPEPEDPLQGRLVTRVAYHGPAPRRVDLRVTRAGGAVLLNESADMTPGSTRDFATGLLACDGDEVVIALSGDGDARGDNNLSLRLPSRNRIRVALSGDVPAALRTGLESDPAVAVVDPADPHDIDVRTGPSDATIERPTLFVDASSAAAVADAPLFYAANHPLTRNLSFEGGQPADAGAREGALMELGEVTLATYVPGAPARAVFSTRLWSNEPGLYRQPAFAVLLTRVVRQLAGWDAQPIALSPRRVLEDPLWADRAMVAGPRNVMPAERSTADLAAPAEQADAPSTLRGSWGRMRGFELAILLAVALFLGEAYLQTRGRIA
ncbi:MAG TPA: hypothetical protein PL151_16180 [Phycisphaerae bacterium]|nr:hypothetical protein [Phycisphaerae bacterium]HOJ75717.1 hypothetical protein [Phycisphaerae bacterium]HOM53142.1 hypothetical protein [Phycisphaerae bacterium]HON67761.1 hypothetical protein [Phycisphaerae bacterium]HOQ86713.1 hypothetical protein [Phycisphaerae bacterium]